MTNPVVRVENLSKYYRLGVIGGGTLREDISRWWAQKRGKPDPYLKIGEDSAQQPRGGQIWALEDINLEVNQGEILGIIGRNGAGKSTLLKILSRITAPTSGRALIKGRVGSLLEVGTGFHPELTGRENIYLNGAILGMRHAEVTRKLDEIVAFAEVAKFVDTPVKRYSSGMLVRLAFAVAAHLDPEILIVDEVLAVGDAAFQRKCLGKMKDFSSDGRTVIFVSHNMGTIESLCSKGLCIANGKIQHEGEIGYVVNKYLETNKVKRKHARLDDREDGYHLLVKEPHINIRSGEKLCVSLAFKSPKTITDLSVGLILYDNRESPVMGASSRHQGVYGETGMAWQSEIDFGPIPIIEGEYTLTVYMGDHVRDYAKFSNAISISVIATNPFGYGKSLPKSWGSIYWAPAWKFSSK